MIGASLAYFIGAQTDLTALSSSFKSFLQTPDLDLSALKAPFALVTPMGEGAEELWEIGDSKRQIAPRYQAAFYGTSDEMMRQFDARFRRLLASATATDVNSITHPGIDFKAFADLLIDSGDHKNYVSNQPGWFSSPTPVVYKNEDSAGEPVVVASGYSVDSTLGKVTFTNAIQAADRVRASYKIGVIDFSILGVDRFTSSQVEDVANNPQRYVVAFSLEPFVHVKTSANRWL